MKPATKVTIGLLLLVAIGHAARLVLGVPVMVGGLVVPQWVSMIGTLFPVVLAAALWRESTGAGGSR